MAAIAHVIDNAGRPVSPRIAEAQGILLIQVEVGTGPVGEMRPGETVPLDRQPQVAGKPLPGSPFQVAEQTAGLPRHVAQAVQVIRRTQAAVTPAAPQARRVSRTGEKTCCASSSCVTLCPP